MRGILDTNAPARPTAGGVASGVAEALGKAAALAETLPWLRRFHGRCVVVKYGGHAMADEPLRRAFAEDVVFLWYAGLRPVIVHGGGPQIDGMLRRLGIEPAFAAGLRVTPPETMEIVRMVLVGRVGGDIVELINRQGPYAVGLSGLDANLLTARRRDAWVDGEPVDLGQVGDITAVDTGVLRGLLDDGRIPVVSGLAHGAEGEILNVNADTVAAALALELGAAKLAMLTDVGGLCPGWPASDEVLAEITADDLEVLLPKLSAGMIPKMEGCLRAVRGGVPQAHVLDGRVPHALLLEMFTDGGAGTSPGLGTKVVPE